MLWAGFYWFKNGISYTMSIKGLFQELKKRIPQRLNRVKHFFKQDNKDMDNYAKVYALLAERVWEEEYLNLKEASEASPQTDEVVST